MNANNIKYFYYNKTNLTWPNQFSNLSPTTALFIFDLKMKNTAKILLSFFAARSTIYLVNLGQEQKSLATPTCELDIHSYRDFFFGGGLFG
jgi:hypothetical protein